MSPPLKGLCRLCITTCKDFKSLYKENGHGNSLYKMAYDFFHPKIIDMEEAKHLTVICLQCFQKIYDFHTFQTLVMVSQFKLSGQEKNLNSRKPEELQNSECSSVQDPLRITVKVKEEEEFIDLPVSDSHDDGGDTKFNFDMIEEISYNSTSEDSVVKPCLTSTLVANVNEPITLTEEPESHDKINFQTEFQKFKGSHPDGKVSQYLPENHSNIIDGHSSNPKTSPDHDHQLDDRWSKWMPQINCVSCTKTFPKLSLLEDHFGRKHLTDEFHILCCSQKWTNRLQIAEHLLIHSEESTFRCKICSKAYKSDESLRKHLTNYHLEKQKFTCKICSKSFATYRGYADHCLVLHNTSIMERPKRLIRPDGTPYKCRECGKYNFINYRRLMEHMALHFNKDIYGCVYCPKTYRSLSSMNYHRKTVHPYERRTKYYTNIADFTVDINEGAEFSEGHAEGLSSGNILGDTAESAELNEESAVQELYTEANSDDFLLVHISDPPAVQEIFSGAAQSSQVTSYSTDTTTLEGSNLKKKKHRKKAPRVGKIPKRLKLICPECGKKKFRNLTFFKEHVASHHQKSLYTCKYCPETFIWNMSAIRHRRKEHPHEADPGFYKKNEDEDPNIEDNQLDIIFQPKLEIIEEGSMTQSRAYEGELMEICQSELKTMDDGSGSKWETPIKVESFDDDHEKNVFKTNLKTDLMKACFADSLCENQKMQICRPKLEIIDDADSKDDSSDIVEDMHENQKMDDADLIGASVSVTEALPIQISQPKLEIIDDPHSLNASASVDSIYSEQPLQISQAELEIIDVKPITEDYKDGKDKTGSAMVAIQEQTNQTTDYNWMPKGLPNIKCIVCGHSYPQLSSLKRHFKQKHPKSEFYIECCSRKIKNKIDHHILLHSNPEAFKCDLCDIAYQTRTALQRHTTMKHPEKQKFPCKQCGKRYQTEAGVTIHTSFCHNADERDSFRKLKSDTGHRCTLCNKTLATYRNFREHMAFHQNKDIYKCAFCPQTFKRLTTLVAHRKELHPHERNKEFYTTLNSDTDSDETSTADQISPPSNEHLKP